jgi:hypothetical protein
VLGIVLGSLVLGVVMLEGSARLVTKQVVGTLSLVVEFVGRSPPRDQYEFGRSRIFESQRGYGPSFLFRGTRTSPVSREWFSLGGSRFARFDTIDRNFDRCGRMDVANPTFEEMARHWFDTFGTSPSVDSFSHSSSRF